MPSIRPLALALALGMSAPAVVYATPSAQQVRAAVARAARRVNPLRRRPALGRPRGLIIIAHRGGDAATENTLENDRNGVLVQHAHGFENDYRATTDSLVMSHDGNLQRVAGVDFDIAKHTTSETQAVRFPDGTHAPTVDDVSEDRDLASSLHYYEHKFKFGQRRRTVDRMVATLQAHAGLQPQVHILSFDPIALRKYARALPNVSLGLLLPANRFYAAALRAAAIGVPYDTIHPEFSRVTRRSVERMHAQGYRVIPYTYKQMADVLDDARDGVDGFITDHPAAARKTLRQRGFELAPLPRLRRAS